MNAASAVLLALVVGVAGAYGGYTYAQNTAAPCVVVTPTEYSWSADKVSAEIAEARALPAGLERTKRLFGVVRHVTPMEERVVVERLPLQTDDGVSYIVRDRLLDRWAMEDPQAAMAYTQRLSDPADRERATLVVAKAWVQLDAAAALNGAPPGAVMAAWVDMDPAGAVKREYTLPLVNDEHPHAAMSAWLARDPDGAIKWVRENPTSPEAAAYVGLIVAGKPALEAKEWVNALPPGDVRSSAQGQLATLIAAAQPNEALRLVRTMNPGPARANAAATVLTTLRRTEQEDIADEFLETTPLTTEERKTMNQRISAIVRAGR
ncbi:MAG: hypothetical protein ACAI38_05540 [Myxococcota bacterium]